MNLDQITAMFWLIKMLSLLMLTPRSLTTLGSKIIMLNVHRNVDKKSVFVPFVEQENAVRKELVAMDASKLIRHPKLHNVCQTIDS